LPFEEISGYLNIELPEHFTVSKRPIVELLRESDVLLYTGSTTCVEAIAAGVPPVHVESDLSIDLDRLDFDPGIRASARDPGEIVKCVEAAVSMSEEELSKKRKIWDSVVKDLFGSVDDSVYRMFSR
jgi:predicted glycosyltransferase